jgi:hypothetical protein
MHYFKENPKALSDKILESQPKLEDALGLASKPIES